VPPVGVSVSCLNCVKSDWTFDACQPYFHFFLKRVRWIAEGSVRTTDGHEKEIDAGVSPC
jgi:hypothetical protein